MIEIIQILKFEIPKFHTKISINWEIKYWNVFIGLCFIWGFYAELKMSYFNLHENYFCPLSQSLLSHFHSLFLSLCVCLLFNSGSLNFYIPLSFSVTFCTFPSALSLWFRFQMWPQSSSSHHADHFQELHGICMAYENLNNKFRSIFFVLQKTHSEPIYNSF